MIETTALMFAMAAVAVGISWAVPSALALDAVAVWTLAVLVAVAPASAAWLLATAALTPLVLLAGERSGRRGLAALTWSLALLAAFVAARLSPGIAWIGGAYFTLRALHVVGDWWMHRLAVPTLRSHLRYQLFLPVIVVGPIHRFETFERQARRRRWDAAAFFTGMERALIGAFSAIVAGSWLMGSLGEAAADATQRWTLFLQNWLQSAIEWIALYFVFAGFTSVALGLSLMIGLRLEENFNRPWAARNLIEFWMRWHMSLTRWSREYVFRPVTAFTRNAAAGVMMAMLFVGLWHEFSPYYLLWSCWQAGGIILTRLLMNWLPLATIPLGVRATIGPLLILGWLSLASPVITILLRPFA